MEMYSIKQVKVENLHTTRNDPRPQMILKFFHARPEMIPLGIIGMEWDDV